ncbi:MAG: LysR family transcriptional regulator [Campylobacterota bacterium]
MLKDFSKIETFLTVVRERSFSKASAKLGVSQPAVTQQIKALEKYLNASIVKRKKNGILLTSEGEEFYKIAQRLEKCLTESQKDIVKIINKELTFRIGASFTIGNFIIPGKVLNNIKEVINNDVMIKINYSQQVIDDLKDKKIDVGLIENVIYDDELVYKEWLDDELVIFSNKELPRFLQKEDFYKYDWICREENSHTKRLMSEIFQEVGVDCSQFNILSEVGNATAVKQSILLADKSENHQTISVISRFAILEELMYKKLFESKIRGYDIRRKMYIAYRKDRKHDPYISNITNYLLSGKANP